MIRRPVHALALSVLAAALCGCATTRAADTPARPDPGPQVAAIALCKTSEADLRATFGQPTREGRLRDARVLSWITGEGDGGVTHYLAVLLDAQDRVADLYWDLPTEIPWTPTDQCKGR